MCVLKTLLLFPAANAASHTHIHTLAFKRMRLLKLESYLKVRAVFCRGEFKKTVYIQKSKQDLKHKHNDDAKKQQIFAYKGNYSI